MNSLFPLQYNIIESLLTFVPGKFCSKPCFSELLCREVNFLCSVSPSRCQVNGCRIKCTRNWISMRKADVLTHSLPSIFGAIRKSLQRSAFSPLSPCMNKFPFQARDEFSYPRTNLVLQLFGGVTVVESSRDLVPSGGPQLVNTGL